MARGYRAAEPGPAIGLRVSKSASVARYIQPMAAPLSQPSLDFAPRGYALTEPTGGLAAGWALLHEAGDALAELAQLGREPADFAPRDFAMRAAVAGPTRLALAEQAIDDCAAALHSGLNALIAATEAGRDCTAAALTLWREFDRARNGLIALTAPLH